MVKAVADRGGQVVLKQKVIKIEVKNGQAVGVKTADGSTYQSKRGIVACVTPKQFITLVDEKELPQSFVVKSKKYRFGPGTLMVHLTLDRPLEWDSSRDLTDSTYVHIAPYMQDIAATYNQIMQGHLPSSPMLVVAQQSRLDPGRAPNGKHILWVQARAFPSRPTGDALGQINVGNWDEMKEPLSERIISKLAQFAPNIKDILRKKMVYSPQDLENENPNIAGGDMVGGVQNLNQNFMFRPFAGWSKYRTPIKRLYLTGHSTWPGGGLNATSGHLAAMAFLKGK
jgi:phytoene dehydrogenase-like protein